MQVEGRTTARQRLIDDVNVVRERDYRGAQNPTSFRISVYGSRPRDIEEDGSTSRAQIHLPYRRRPGCAIRVERVHAVVHGRHIEHIHRAFAGNAQPMHVKRLRVDLAIHRIRQDFAELRGIHVIQVQQAFVQVRVSPIVVVVRSDDICLGPKRACQQ